MRCKLNRNCKSKTEPDTTPVQCESNDDCSSDTYCEGSKGMCISPCGSTSVCATNEKCVANLHKASCQCKHKLVINAAGELTCPGIKWSFSIRGSRYFSKKGANYALRHRNSASPKSDAISFCVSFFCEDFINDKYLVFKKILLT